MYDTNFEVFIDVPGYLKWELHDVNSADTAEKQPEEEPPLLPQPPIDAQAQQKQIDPERPYQCPRCFKNYMQFCTLKRHIRLECGITPRFQCPHCPHKAKRNDELSKHIFRRHITKGSHSNDINKQ